MKIFKRLVCVLLCVCTLFMLATPAFAADADDITTAFIRQPKDMVIYQPYTQYDPDRSITEIQIDYEIDEYYRRYCDVELRTDYGETIRKAKLDSSFSKEPLFIKRTDPDGTYYIVIRNDRQGIYIESEPFEVTFREKSFSQKMEITRNAFGPAMQNLFKAIGVFFRAPWEAFKMLFEGVKAR